MSPVTFIAEGICDVFLHIFKQDTDIDQDEFSEEDVISLLEAGEKSGELKKLTYPEAKRLLSALGMLRE